MISRSGRLVYSQLLTGHTLNGELETIAKPFRRVAEQLAARSLDERPAVWDGFLAAQDSPDEIVEALVQVDPLGPAPDAEAAGVGDDGWEPLRLGKLPEVERFPLEVLPHSAADFIAPYPERSDALRISSGLHV